MLQFYVNFSTIGIGAYQPSRLDIVKMVVQKQGNFNPQKLRIQLQPQMLFFHLPMVQTHLLKWGKNYNSTRWIN